ncbi:MAG: hypothetical protein JWR50_191 [Mucilaginibacter sp.]|nr:hypothetical protein [Mucilaginibacter sp.]
MKKTLLVVLLGVACLASCKKDKKGNTDNPPKNGSTFDLIRDSVFLYAKEAYYWNDGLPTYDAFNPRSFTGTDDLTALTKEVNAISQYKINPTTSKPYEYYAPSPGEAKYSFIDQGEVSTELNGTNKDFGFAPFYNAINDLRVKYVYPGSPADLAGIKRGYRILSINGNSNISYDDGGSHTQFVINAYANSNTISLTLQKPTSDTTTVNFNVSLNVNSYAINPVLTYKIINTANSKKIGYIVFNSFTSDDNADPKLDEAFNYFQSQDITDLVVDLRYNGGGYVSTAEYLDNLIVPAAKNNTTMYTYHFNDLLVAGKQKLLYNQVRRDPDTKQLYNYGQFDYTIAGNTVTFAKKGLLAISRVFFIVSGATASASELTINNLRPHLDVQLIGSQTYGKPVGFFDIDINKYQMYIPEFETQNSAGQGGYYSGMTPGTGGYSGVTDYDDASFDFGDPRDSLLKHAINYVTHGTYSISKQRIQSLSTKQKDFSIEQSNTAAIELNRNKFTGMVFNKKFKLKK